VTVLLSHTLVPCRHLPGIQAGPQRVTLSTRRERNGLRRWRTCSGCWAATPYTTSGGSSSCCCCLEGKVVIVKFSWLLDIAAAEKSATREIWLPQTMSSFRSAPSSTIGWPLRRITTLRHLSSGFAHSPMQHEEAIWQFTEEIGALCWSRVVWTVGALDHTGLHALFKDVTFSRSLRTRCQTFVVITNYELSCRWSLKALWLDPFERVLL